MEKRRESGIELLKVIAVLLIVIGHVTQSLTEYIDYFYKLGYTEGFIHLNPSTDIQITTLMLMRYIGKFSNVIFVICSSWFLIDSKKDRKNKAIKLWANTVVISILYVIIFMALNVNIDDEEIFRSFLPNIFENNWFITTYLLFIMTVPLLNIIIEKLDKKLLFRTSAFLFIVYFIIAFLQQDFSYCQIINFISIYFIIAYSKKYMQNFWNNKRYNNIIIIGGIILIIGVQVLTNYLSVNYGFMSNKGLYWSRNNNPLILFVCIALFYKFKNLKIKNNFINSISSLSLYIYLIHENFLFRNNIRVHIWHYIYEQFGYDHVIIEIIVYAIVLFILATILSFIYKVTFEKIINYIADRAMNSKKLNGIITKVENKLLSIN